MAPSWCRTRRGADMALIFSFYEGEKHVVLALSQMTMPSLEAFVDVDDKDLHVYCADCAQSQNQIKKGGNLG